MQPEPAHVAGWALVAWAVVLCLSVIPNTRGVVVTVAFAVVLAVVGGLNSCVERGPEGRPEVLS